MHTNDIEIHENRDILQLVGFMIDSEEYAIDILAVQEILKPMKITKVPNALNYVEGVVNIRGRVIPIINLRCILDLPQKDFDDKTRIIVVEVENITSGFIVESVTEVLRIPTDLTETTPELTTSVNSDFISSVANFEDRLLILLEIEKILSPTNGKQLLNT